MNWPLIFVILSSDWKYINTFPFQLHYCKIIISLKVTIIYENISRWNYIKTPLSGNKLNFSWNYQYRKYRDFTNPRIDETKNWFRITRLEPTVLMSHAPYWYRSLRTCSLQCSVGFIIESPQVETKQSLKLYTLWWKRSVSESVAIPRAATTGTDTTIICSSANIRIHYQPSQTHSSLGNMNDVVRVGVRSLSTTTLRLLTLSHTVKVS